MLVALFKRSNVCCICQLDKLPATRLAHTRPSYSLKQCRDVAGIVMACLKDPTPLRKGALIVYHAVVKMTCGPASCGAQGPKGNGRPRTLQSKHTPAQHSSAPVRAAHTKRRPHCCASLLCFRFVCRCDHALSCKAGCCATPASLRPCAAARGQSCRGREPSRNA